MVGSSLFIGTTAAHADVTVISVTNLGLSGEGSLQAALNTVNSAAAESNPDGFSIVFDESLAGGTIEFDSASDEFSMYTEHVGNPSGQVNDTIGQNGARFLVNAQVPVSIDFGGVQITDVDASHAAGIYVASNNVTISNIGNLHAAEAGIAVSGDNVAINDSNFIDDESSDLEAGIALLDGADGTSISNVAIASSYWSNVLVDTDATVSNTTITGLSSRGAQGYGHVIFEDGSTVNNFSLSASTLGTPTESSPKPGFYFNPGNVVNGLTVQGTTVQSPGQDVFYFEGDNQVFTGTVIDGNTFGGNADAPIDQIFEESGATYNGLTFTNNVVSYAASTVIDGSITDGQIAGNSFTNIDDGGRAVLQLGNELSNVTIEGNDFNHNWTLDQIHITGTSATDVTIQDNDIRNLEASVSRSGLRIDAPGSGNVVQNNQFIQELDNPDVPATVDNHWAIRNYADAPSAEEQVGWTIQYNHIDGFGGQDRSEAPIVHDAVGKLPVIGNTFGPNTRGSLDAETEESAYWFVWNVWNNLSNNTVQTYRATEVAYDGANASFTAVAPELEAGNNEATVPVTLHVYWTADDNAEEYLGAIEEVSPGQRVSIPTEHTNGVIRVQTVDANGYTSQYSSVDPTAPIVTPAPPADIVPTEVGAAGSGQPGAGVIVRDAEGNPVAEAVVAEDGSWSVEGLECGVDYSAAQVVDGVEGSAADFTTTECAVTTPAAPADVEGTEDGATGTAEPGASVIVRDAEGNVVAEVEVAEDGTWSVEGLECGVDYSAAQVVDGVEGNAAEFTTTGCDDGAGNDDGSDDGTGSDDGAGSDDGTGSDDGAGSDDGTGSDDGAGSEDTAGSDDVTDGSDDGGLLASTGATVSAGVLGGAALLVAAGVGLTAMNRRRSVELD